MPLLDGLFKDNSDITSFAVWSLFKLRKKNDFISKLLNLMLSFSQMRQYGKSIKSFFLFYFFFFSHNSIHVPEIKKGKLKFNSKSRIDRKNGKHTHIVCFLLIWSKVYTIFLSRSIYWMYSKSVLRWTN